MRSRGGAPSLAFGHRLARFEPGHPWQGAAGVPEDLPPVSFIRAWSPLATRGRVGLVAAYAYRPLWVLWHAGPSLWALARTRMSARRGR